MFRRGRIGRAARIAASRSADYAALRNAGSVDECVAWSKTNPSSMFNGNAVRARILYELFVRFRCDLFVETGTSHAATAIGAHKLMQAKVLTCENSPIDYYFAAVMALGLKDIRRFRMESTVFLPMVARDIRARNRNPLIYLDAHEGRLNSGSLPLKEELDQILLLDRFVCVIDDFKVENFQYRYGTYADVSVDLPLVRETLHRGGIHRVFMPNYGPGTDTGFPSGYCVFWRGHEEPAAERNQDRFPFSLLQGFDLH
jgi:hypothetical protein